MKNKMSYKLLETYMITNSSPIIVKYCKDCYWRSYSRNYCSSDAIATFTSEPVEVTPRILAECKLKNIRVIRGYLYDGHKR